MSTQAPAKTDPATSTRGERGLKKTIPADPTTRRLTAKQRALVDAYLDRSAATYGNGTQSALAVYSTTDPQTAADIAHRTLKLPYVQSYVEQQLIAQGYGVDVRLADIAAIARGVTSDRVSTKVYTRNEQGKRRLASETITERPPTAKDRLTAHRVLNDMSGLREAREVAKVHALREVRDLYDRIVS